MNAAGEVEQVVGTVEEAVCGIYDVFCCMILDIRTARIYMQARHAP